MSSKKQLNHEHVINSLANKLVNAEVESSEKDAVIIALSQENEELKKDNENLREQLKENTRNDSLGRDIKITTGTLKQELVQSGDKDAE